MPANSYRPEHTIDWSRFKELPSEVETGIDVAALQARLDVLNEHPIRWLSGTFSCPKAARRDQYLQARKKAIERFVQAMEKQGWELYGRIAIYESAFPVSEPGSHIVVEDKQEYTIRAMFRKLHWRPLRIELPGHLLRKT